MSKSPDAFRTISEVAEWLGVQAHVLRFWESKFSQVKPIKRAGGRRYYRPADMQILGGIKRLLHDDGMTIKGVQKVLREKGPAEVSALSQPLDGVDASEEAAAADDVMQFRSRSAAMGAGAAEQAMPAATGTATGTSHLPDFGEAPPEESTAPAPTAPPVAPEPETPVQADPAPAAIPSFMNQGAGQAIPKVDAEDPPADADIAYVPGLLFKLARLSSVDAAQAAELAPLAQQLRAWVQQAHANALK